MIQHYPWGHPRRFNSYTEHMKARFGGRVQKISVDAGFTCPNRDATISVGGCTYCSNEAFTPSYCQPDNPLLQQVSDGIAFHAQRYRRASRFMVYFQAYTNTYGDVEVIKALYEEALSHPKVIGLVIGTRPDCMPDELLEYLSQLNKTHPIIIEYGIESVYEETLVRVNRGHTFKQGKETLHKTAESGIACGAHFIFGLPGESRRQMLEASRIISGLPLTFIKFHQLQLIKGTAMTDDYLSNPSAFCLFDFDNYVDFIIDFTEMLNPAIVIERFAAEVPPRFLNTALWNNLRYDQILRIIELRMEERNSWQGKFFYADNE